MNMKVTGRRLRRLAAAAVAAPTLMAGKAFAGSSNGSLPWESPLTTIKDSLTGPVALAVSIIALAAGGGALVFGGELSDFVRRLIMLVMAIALLVGGASFMTTVFPNATGALIP